MENNCLTQNFGSILDVELRTSTTPKSDVVHKMKLILKVKLLCSHFHKYVPVISSLQHGCVEHNFICSTDDN